MRLHRYHPYVPLPTPPAPKTKYSYPEGIPPDELDDDALKAMRALVSKDGIGVRVYMEASIKKKPEHGFRWAETYLRAGESSAASAIFGRLGSKLNDLNQRNSFSAGEAWEAYLNAACCTVFKKTHRDVDWNRIALFEYPSLFLSTSSDWLGSQWRLSYFCAAELFTRSPSDAVYLLQALILLDYKRAIFFIARKEHLAEKLQTYKDTVRDITKQYREVLKLEDFIERLKEHKKDWFFRDFQYALLPPRIKTREKVD